MADAFDKAWREYRRKVIAKDARHNEVLDAKLHYYMGAAICMELVLMIGDQFDSNAGPAAIKRLDGEINNGLKLIVEKQKRGEH